MNRTAALVAGGVVALLLGAVALPWWLGTERYAVRHDLVVTWNGEAVRPQACLTGEAAPLPFPGLELILPGGRPRLRLLRAHDGRLGEVGLDHSGRVERLPKGACSATTFEVRGNGRTAYNVEGVEGRVDLTCTQGELTFRVAGAFANCFRPD